MGGQVPGSGWVPRTGHLSGVPSDLTARAERGGPPHGDSASPGKLRVCASPGPTSHSVKPSSSDKCGREWGQALGSRPLVLRQGYCGARCFLSAERLCIFSLGLNAVPAGMVSHLEMTFWCGTRALSQPFFMTRSRTLSSVPAVSSGVEEASGEPRQVPLRETGLKCLPKSCTGRKMSRFWPAGALLRPLKSRKTAAS